jgi:chromosome partitioning protein
VLVSLVNSKGGVGKSTLAVHLACLAHAEGRSVAFVDADAQESGSRWVKGMGSPFRVHRIRSPDEMIERMDGIVESVDLVVADGPAGFSDITRSLILVSDLALLPCGPSVLDMESLRDVLRVVRNAQKVRKGPPEAVLIPNKLQAKYRLSRELLEAAVELGIPSLDGLRLRQAYADAAGQRSVVWRLKAEDATREIRHLYHQIEQRYPNAGSQTKNQ